MKITEHIKNAKGKTLFSFELLPPVKGKSIQAIYNAIDPLMDFKTSRRGLAIEEIFLKLRLYLLAMTPKIRTIHPLA